MKDSIYPQMKIIETDKYIFRPICLDDASNMFEYLSQEEVVRYLPIKIHKSVIDTKRFIRSYFISSYKRGNINHWAIIDKRNNNLVGNIGFNDISVNDKEGEIGICINPKYWGHDIATELTKYPLMYGFKFLKLEKIIAISYEENPKTRKSLTNCGFKHVKTFNRKLKISNLFKIKKCDKYELCRKDYILSRFID